MEWDVPKVSCLSVKEGEEVVGGQRGGEHLNEGVKHNVNGTFSSVLQVNSMRWQQGCQTGNNQMKQALSLTFFSVHLEKISFDSHTHNTYTHIIDFNWVYWNIFLLLNNLSIMFQLKI